MEVLDLRAHLFVELATDVCRSDDAVDGLYTQVFRELLTYMLQDQTKIEPSLDLILISRHLERIGDHATNVAEVVYFQATGEALPAMMSCCSQVP